MDIEKYRKDFEIVRLTAEQLIKDFELSGLEVVFSGNELTAYEELKNQAAPLLAEMYQKRKQDFQSLLYRIDLSEKKFREIVNTSTSETFPTFLAEAIIQREFQKVLTRKFFS